MVLYFYDVIVNFINIVVGILWWNVYIVIYGDIVLFIRFGFWEVNMVVGYIDYFLNKFYK